MKIVDLRINGMENPIGFCFDTIICSWKVRNTKSKKQVFARIVVGTEESLSHPVYKKEGSDLKSSGEPLKIKLKPCTRYFCQIEVIGENGESAKSGTAWFETGKMNQSWEAEFITTQSEDSFHPEFLKLFLTQKKVHSARLYICGLGLYEAYINQQKAGEDFLAPFTGDYNQKLQYQTYDVTALLQAENTISVICGNGWYKGRLGYQGHSKVYGDYFWLIAELCIRYADGTKEIIATDKTWNYRGSDIESSDLYDGEVFDRQLWKDTENPLKQVRESLECKDAEQNRLPDKDLLTERSSLSVKAHEHIPAAEILYTPAGETVLDFGQNLAGYVEFYSDFAAGTKIVLDFGEILLDGNFYNENYRTAKAQFVYVSDGRAEKVRPHFTSYGFRYVRVSGLKGDTKELLKEQSEKAEFTARAVYSDLTVTGNIKTSDWRINRLFENCMWGQKSNFLDIPTDCPQRDERLGWTGDAQVFAPTASFNMDTRAFYGKYLDDLRLEQKSLGGAIANFIPNYAREAGGASVWGDAATFIPMTLYEYYGDKNRLAHDFPMMQDWVDYLSKQAKQHGSHPLIASGMQFGDWLAMDGITEQSFKGGTDEYFIASVYYYASAQKTAQAAEILGKSKECKRYGRLAEQIRKAILDEYFSVNGRLCIDTQTAYLLSLRFQLYQNKNRILEGLQKRLEKDCYRIRCGFVGAPQLCQVLSENGMEDMAYRILFYEGFPGWLRCIRLGATTIWERWNSVLDDGHLSGTDMNSLNHYAYGSVVEYLYRQVAGISPLEPGFRKVKLAPKLNNRLHLVECSYDSVNGAYRISWEWMKSGEVKLRVEVPFNCEALLQLPGAERDTIKLESGVFEKVYLPSVDYTRPFDENSILEELSENAEAVAVLKEYAPAAIGMLQRKDREQMALSMKNLLAMPYLGFDAQKVMKAVEKLKQIQVF